jgi:hypothetical protein
VDRNDFVGAIDSNNHVVAPFHYEFLRPLDSIEFLFGYRAKYFGEYNCGVMSLDQKVKIPPIYRYITKYKGYYNVIIEYDSVIGNSSMGDVRSVKNSYGLLDGSGKALIPCRYNYISWMNNSLYIVDSSFASTDRKFIETNCSLFNKIG